MAVESKTMGVKSHPLLTAVTRDQHHAGIETLHLTPCNAGTSTPEWLGDYPVWTLDAATEYLGFKGKMPLKMDALVSVKVFGIKITDGTIDFTATTDFAGELQAYTEHSDSVTGSGIALNNTLVQSLDLTAAFTGLVAGDLFGIKLVLDAISAGSFKITEVEFSFTLTR